MVKRKLNNNLVSFKYKDEEIEFFAPWLDASTIDKSALSLIEYLLLSPREDIDIIEWNSRWDKIWLAYSWGTDSTAAYALLKGTQRLFNFYHKRIWINWWLMRQDNPLKVIQENNIDCTIVSSNHEKIRTNFWLMAWFSTDWSPLCSAILYAWQLWIKYLSTWTMLESTYIQKWYIYIDFNYSAYRKKWSDIFKKCWFELLLPVAWASEFVTNSICEQAGLISSPCIRWEGEPCMNCYKCFRKETIKWNIVDMNKEAKYFLSKRPLKQWASLIHAMNKFWFDIQDISEYKWLHIDRIEEYYHDAFDIIPLDMQEYLYNEVTKYVNIYKSNDIRDFNIFTSVW